MEYHIKGYTELHVSGRHPFGVLGVGGRRARGVQADMAYAQQLCFTFLFAFGLYVGFLQHEGSNLGLKFGGKPPIHMKYGNGSVDEGPDYTEVRMKSRAVICCSSLNLFTLL